MEVGTFNERKKKNNKKTCEVRKRKQNLNKIMSATHGFTSQELPAPEGSDVIQSPILLGLGLSAGQWPNITSVSNPSNCMFEGRLTRDHLFLKFTEILSFDRSLSCVYKEKICGLWISAYSLKLARGSEDVSGARAASTQASILSGPLGAGDMHVPVNI